MSDLVSRQAVMKEFSDFVRRANNSDFAKTPQGQISKDYEKKVKDIIAVKIEELVDYVEAARLSQKNRKECAEWLKDKDEFWIVSEKGDGDEGNAKG